MHEMRKGTEKHNANFTTENFGAVICIQSVGMSTEIEVFSCERVCGRFQSSLINLKSEIM